MDLIIASGQQMPKPENIGIDLAFKPAIHAVMQDWQVEILFLKTKFDLLIRLIKWSHYSGPRFSLKKEEFEKELLRLMDQDLRMFQNRAKKLLEEWKANKFPDQPSLVAYLKEFRMLHRKWQELKSEQRELEIQILEVLIKNYPTKIF